MGDIPHVTLWCTPTVTFCTQPEAQDHQPRRTPFSKGAGCDSPCSLDHAMVWQVFPSPAILLIPQIFG